MHGIMGKKLLGIIFLSGFAFASTAALAESRRETALTAEQIENQAKQQWKDEAKACRKEDLTQIARVELISSEQYKAWLAKHRMANGEAANVVPNAKYVKVMPLSQSGGDGIAAYGPVEPTAQTIDFKNLVGMHICAKNPHGK